MPTGVDWTQQDGNIGASTPSGRRPIVLLGAADSGDYNSPRALTRDKQVDTLLTGGPLHKACLYAVAKGLTVIPIRVQANQTGSCSSVDNANMTPSGSGGAVAGIDPAHDLPNGNYSVKILFPIGGTVGTAGIYYQISLDGTHYGELQALGTSQTISVTGAGDVTVTLSGTGTIANGNYATFTTTAVSAGTLGTITDNSGVGESTITHDATSTVNDDFEVEVAFTLGGLVGAGGGLVKYRFRTGPEQGTADDPWAGWSVEYQLGTATSITLANTGGIKLAIGAGSIAIGRRVSFRTTAPGFTAGDHAAGITALQAYSGDWEIFSTVGPVDGTIFDAIDLFMNSLPAEPIGLDRIAVCGFRIPNAGETDAQYQTAFKSTFGAKASALGYTILCVGSVKVTVKSRTQRRSPAFVYAPSLASVDEHIMIGRRTAPGGALVACSIKDANGNPDDHDEKYTPGLEDARALCLCAWSDKAGVFVFWDRTFASQDSDFALVPHRRIMNTGMAAVRSFGRDQIAIGLEVMGGKLTPAALDSLNRGGTAVMRRVLKGKVSPESEVIFDGTANLAAEGAELEFDLWITPLLYPKKLHGNAGLKNPLNQ